ncbi:hypothetical protein N473_06215 [Pseudoalteromonas luteoviolacea CPMOR-1]|uniref:Uncharacterized protein n=1 Tax=Pseudoalteromonas luteoviolacea CPMOR-1 TaxID=1365248 RepID=A0A167HNV1_9GAMM|nr:hypothetical protein N473_06215 [Pseudoalteromonas luteoviolacea CPMOR-1]
MPYFFQINGVGEFFRKEAIRGENALIRTFSA